MSQMNLLSVELSQAPEIQSGNSEAPVKSQAKSRAFSDTMAQLYPSKTVEDSSGKAKQGGNFGSKAASEQAEVTKVDDSQRSSDEQSITSNDVNILPLSIDEESLAATLSGNDDVLIVPVPLPTDNVSLTTQSTATLVGDILSMPSNDESRIVGTDTKGDASISSIPTAPLNAENNAIESASLAYKGEGGGQSAAQASYRELQTQSNSSEYDDTVDLLKMLNGSGKLLIKASAADTSIDQSSKPVISTEQVLAADKGMAIKTAEIEQIQLSADIKTGTTTPTDAKALAVDHAVIDNEQIAKASNAKFIEQAAKLSADNQPISLSESPQLSAAERELALAQSKKVLSAELSAENKALSVAGDKVKAERQEGLGQFTRSVSEGESTQTRSINQSTASVVATAATDLKPDANQKTPFDEAFDKSNNRELEIDQLAKAESDKAIPQAEKVASSFNQTLVAQAAKLMITPGELAAQREHNFESTMNQLTTNTVETQKSITALNTETIAIYRKDFANALKDKVMVMINQKIQQVDIQLDPPEMGNIHVRVNLQNEQAAVQFIVQNQQAKDALEQNIGKLRDMLAENGVDVGDANIEQRQAKEQNDDGFDGQANHGQSAESEEGILNENDHSGQNLVKASSTGVDYYA